MIQPVHLLDMFLSQSLQNISIYLDQIETFKNIRIQKHIQKQLSHIVTRVIRITCSNTFQHPIYFYFCSVTVIKSTINYLFTTWRLAYIGIMFRVRVLCFINCCSTLKKSLRTISQCYMLLPTSMTDQCLASLTIEIESLLPC